MTKNQEFSFLLSEVKKRYRFRMAERLLLVSLFLFLLSLLLWEIAGLLSFTDPAGRPPLLFVMASSLALSVVYIFLTWKNEKELLIGLDTRLGLDERLTTSFEYNTEIKRSFFTDQLIRDAITSLTLVDTRRWFPRKVAPILSALMIVGTLWGAVRYSNLHYRISPAVPESDRLIRNPVKDVSQDFERSKSARPSLQKRKREAKDELGKILEQAKLDTEESRSSLEPLLQRISEEKESLTERLASILKKVNPIDISASEDIEEMLQKGKGMDSLGNDLRQFLDKDQYSQLEGNLRRLFELDHLEKVLEDVISDLELKESESENTKPGKEEEQTKANAEGGESPDSAIKDEDEDDGQLVRKKSTGTETKGIRQGDKQPGSETANKIDPDFSTTPGKSASDWDEGYANKIEPKRSTTKKLAGKTGEGKRYQSLIRSLAGKGHLTREERHYLRLYEKDATSVIHREELPLKYRAQIRQYFLSIGLIEETRKE